MLLTAESTDDGQLRVYTSRHASLQGFFTEDDDGGTMFSMEPGFLSFPDLITTGAYMCIRQLALEEAGRRLSCQPHEVEGQPFGRILSIADPAPKYRESWSGRKRVVGRPVR